MIAVDTNVLVHAHRAESPRHEAACERVRSLAEGAATWALPWACVHEFFSVVTHPRIYRTPSTPAEATAQIDAWLASPTLAILSESAMHWRTLARLLAEGSVVGPMVHDARIAAICIDHGVREFVTLDRDFSRFPELQVRSLR